MKSLFKTGTYLAAALMVSQWSFGKDPAVVNNGPETPGQQENKNTQSDSAQRDVQSENQGKMSWDQHFVKHAAWGGMGEVAMAKIAVDKAQNSDIKQFAQRMIDDHTKANNQLKQIAQSNNMDVPSTLDPIDQAKVDQLQKMPAGRNFDRAYIYGQVAAHIETVLWFRDATQDLKNAQLRQFATDTYPTLTAHLQEAEKLAGMGGEAVQAGERIGGSNDAGVTNHATNGSNGTSGINGGTDTSQRPNPNR